MEGKEVRALTGLRGVAACYVVLYHYLIHVALPAPLRTLLVHGYLAVDLFFVLSGYVLALNYGSAFKDGTRLRTFNTFLVARLARVYPLYVTVTLCFTALYFFRPELKVVIQPAVLLSNLTMMQAWGLADSVGGLTWSISAEFAAYLAFPFLVGVVLSQSNRANLLIGAVCLCVLLFLSAQPTPDGRHGPLDLYGGRSVLPLLRCFADFTMGLIAFRFSHLIGASEPRNVTGLTGALIFVALFWPGSDIVIVLLCSVWIPLVARHRAVVSRCLGSPPIHWLGMVSYSIYLDHRLVEYIVYEPIEVVLKAHTDHADIVSFGITALCTLCVATASFYLVERPARTWIRSLSGVRPGSITAAPATP